jgi:YegS/Rv2252/BmrU family lipid kinase
MAQPSEIQAVVNPAAANGRAGRRWPRIVDRLRSAGWRIHEHLTRAPGDATRVTHELLRQGAREFLAVGGDGTVNEIVNGLSCEDTWPRATATLSVLPLGTGRDFARNIGIGSVHEAIAALDSDSIVELDLGLATITDAGGRCHRRFVNIATTGLGASVAERVHRSARAFGGSAAYLVGTLMELVSYRPASARVVIDDQVVHDGPLALALIANGRSCAGGMVPAPHASLCDGLLDVLICRPVSRGALAFGLLPDVYRGRPIRHPAVGFARGASIRIQAEHPIRLALDGEACDCLDLHVAVEPAALRVRVSRYAAASMSLEAAGQTALARRPDPRTRTGGTMIR